MDAPAGDPPRVRLLLDEMWPPAVAEALRERGHDAMAVAEYPELRTKPDAVIFEQALREGWAIVTEDVADYRMLAAKARDDGREAPAFVFTSPRAWPRGRQPMIGRLVTALDALLNEPAGPEGEYWLD